MYTSKNTFLNDGFVIFIITDLNMTNSALGLELLGTQYGFLVIRQVMTLKEEHFYLKKPKMYTNL